ncbi:Uncharacterised protein [Corynebacterium pilosum]|uniref:Uncharacterized protein n=2 Tax=Corynebacterium pilosum TaxID=35756 RepID=A0A376CMC9_9CORY|nr:Uncharacterised protein [Corynebacterium pilosum]
MGADPKKRELALRMADKAWELKDDPGPAKGAENVFARHSALGSMMKIYYRHRANPEHFKRAVECTELQIEMQAEAMQAWHALEEDLLAKLRKYNPGYSREHPATPPGHLGYKQLAIVLEKEKRYQEALDLVEEAKAAGWSGDWDKRAGRLQKKLS